MKAVDTVAFQMLLEMLDSEDLTGDLSDHVLAEDLLAEEFGGDKEATHQALRRAMRGILVRGVLGKREPEEDPRDAGKRPGSVFCPECGNHRCGIPDGPARLTRCGHLTCPSCVEFYSQAGIRQEKTS
jgi:hypothetical protein